MGDRTGISWTDATWNPVRGCSRVSEGCTRCYAEVQAARIVRMAKGKPSPYDGLVKVTTGGEPRWTGEIRLVPEMLSWPLRKRAPLRIFVNSMSDLFHERLTNEQIAAVFGVMAACPQHTFQILTKRAKRMREWFEWARKRAFEDGESVLDYGLMLSGYVGDEIGNGSLDAAADHSERIQGLINDAWARTGKDGGTVFDTPWPLPNVWLGVSVENQEAADERIPDLLATPAVVRFLSCEPLIGPVELDRWLAVCKHWNNSDSLPHAPWHPPYPKHWYKPQALVAAGWARPLHWVIAGCESGPRSRECSVEWLRSLRDQCAAAGVPYFLKQALETDMGLCGDADNPNGDNPCGERVRYYVLGPRDSSVSCGCTAEGAEDANGCPAVGAGDGSKRKAGGVIELPYLDGYQHAQFPEVSP